MAVNDEYVAYVLDQLECLGDVEPKRMFGGVGLYRDGVFFALIARNVLYFKVDGSNRADYEARGMEPFRPRSDKPTVMQYYEVPVEVLEDTDQLREWARKSYDIAVAKRRK